MVKAVKKVVADRSAALTAYQQVGPTKEKGGGGLLWVGGVRVEGRGAPGLVSCTHLPGVRWAQSASGREAAASGIAWLLVYGQ